MLNRNKTKYTHTGDLPVVVDQVVDQEGLGLISVLVDGQEHAAVAGYAPDARFLGFSYGEKMKPLVIAQVIEDVLSFYDNSPNYNAGEFILQGAPILGQLRVVVGGAVATAVATAGDLAEGTYLLEGTKITFYSGDNEKTVVIQYRFSPTAYDLMIGQIFPYTFATASEMYGRVGVITEGEVHTDQYDVTIDWAALPADYKIIVADGGTLSASGTGLTNTGVEVPGALLIATPTEAEPFVGIRF